LAVEAPIQGLPTGFIIIGRTILTGAADTITVTIAPGFRYLKIHAALLTSGSVNGIIRFNADAGNNYAVRESTNNGADATTTSVSGVTVQANSAAPASFITADVLNLVGSEKYVTALRNAAAAAATNAPGSRQTYGKWANTADGITSVSVVNTDTGDYAIGSEVVVLGLL